MIEIWAKEKYIKEVEPKLENFKKLLTEIKNFVIESKDKKAIEEVEAIEEEIKWEEVEAIEEENEKPVDIENLSIKEIKEILDSRWIEYNPNNNNKQSLIKLLMQ